MGLMYKIKGRLLISCIVAFQARDWVSQRFKGNFIHNSVSHCAQHTSSSLRSTCSNTTLLTGHGNTERWSPRAASSSSATCPSRSSTSTFFVLGFLYIVIHSVWPLSSLQEGSRQHQMGRRWSGLRCGVDRCVHHHREGLCKSGNCNNVWLRRFKCF